MLKKSKQIVRLAGQVKPGERIVTQLRELRVAHNGSGANAAVLAMQLVTILNHCPTQARIPVLHILSFVGQVTNQGYQPAPHDQYQIAVEPRCATDASTNPEIAAGGA